MNKETYLNIADLMTIRLAIADKLATEYLKEYEQESRVEALERVERSVEALERVEESAYLSIKMIIKKFGMM